MPASFALLNGYRVSHASYKCRILGLLVPIKKLDWKVSVDGEDVRANAREPIATTQGEVSYEASLTLYRAEWDQVKARCRTVFGQAPMDTQGDIVVQASERGFPVTNVQIRIWGMKESGASTEQGTAASEIELSLRVAFVFEDGQPMVNNSIWA